MRVRAAALALACIACSDSHTPSPTGVDGARRLADLSDEEWATICEWAEGLRGGGSPTYSCSGAVLLLSLIHI